MDIQNFDDVLVALLAIVNPISKIPYFLDYTEELDAPQRNRIAYITSFSSFIILTTAMLTGTLILQTFGIEISSFRIAGGVMLFLAGLSMIHSSPGKKSFVVKKDFSEIISIAIIPLALPLTAGPGAICTVILFSEGVGNLENVITLFVSILICCLAVYVTLRLSVRIIKLLGQIGMNVMTKIMGLLTIAISVQFITKGLAEIFTNLVK
ncbi:MAG: NAAT family transporter [Ignavibacteria bacterium]|nr:NAAT family transporter [Ignavibacteria bacterium]